MIRSNIPRLSAMDVADDRKCANEAGIEGGPEVFDVNTLISSTVEDLFRVANEYYDIHLLDI